MQSREAWQHYFKPEVQSAGDDLVAEKNVILTVTSDTAINAFVRGTGQSKVSFTSRSIDAPIFQARCSCSRAAKGVFCKHIWAVLMATQEKHPDFLDSKTVIEISAPTPSGNATALKEKQNEYRKLQSEKIKIRNKEIRLEKKAQKKSSDIKTSKLKVRHPLEVQEALDFFEQNGFDLDESLDSESVKEARKTLSRVFHPDKGGSHEESLILNKYYDILIEYLES